MGRNHRIRGSQALSGFFSILLVLYIALPTPQGKIP